MRGTNLCFNQTIWFTMGKSLNVIFLTSYYSLNLNDYVIQAFFLN